MPACAYQRKAVPCYTCSRCNLRDGSLGSFSCARSGTGPFKPLARPIVECDWTLLCPNSKVAGCVLPGNCASAKQEQLHVCRGYYCMYVLCRKPITHISYSHLEWRYPVPALLQQVATPWMYASAAFLALPEVEELGYKHSPPSSFQANVIYVGSEPQRTKPRL